ncbi:MAG: hypothetical protein LBE82_07875 [Chitinophagaceae bacterium]|jgi:hypothetical protein|nr:hypothetical protein [Chitinophagaceae bacterium]
MNRILFVGKRTLLLMSAITMGIFVFVKCTKDSTTAMPVNRIVEVSSMDSTVFSPFYDSTIVPYANTPAGINDYAVANSSVFGIVKTKCATSSCHGGGVQPALSNYAAVKNLVVAGNPNASLLWQMLTTNLASKAMPPAGNDLSIPEKNVVYNWIMNGAKEQPDISDYRPTAIRTITNGCTSANCHSMPTVVGNWVKNGYVQVSTGDTASLLIGTTLYPQILNKALMESRWQAYSDSIVAFYKDTAHVPFPVVTAMTSHGPFSTYEAIILDANYPKGNRTSSNLATRNDYLNSNTTILRRLDSSLQYANVRTGAWANSTDGGMASSDGGLSPSDVAIIKAWYFLEPNIPDVWKFGLTGTGIFRYVGKTPIVKQ